MINQRKLIIMTKLAIYDKNQAERDDKIHEYFLHDYAYHKNSHARFSALLGCFVLLVFYFLNEAFVKQEDLISLDFRQELVGIGIFVICVLVLFTMISSIKAFGEFRKSEIRRKNYLRLLNQLDHSRNLSSNTQSEEEEY